jgi:AcrR family transcriptional regulator
MKTKPKQPAQAATRDRIIEAAMLLFADSGYEGSTVQNIAAAVGIKAASLYAHFKGKEAIFDAVFKAAIGRWEHMIDDAFAQADDPVSLEDGAVSIISKYLAAMADSISYRFWARVYAFPPKQVTKKQFSQITEADAGFVLRFQTACARMAGVAASNKELRDFASTAAHFAMGLLVDSLGKAPAERDIRTGISLLARGMASSAKKTTKGAIK